MSSRCGVPTCRLSAMPEHASSRLCLELFLSYSYPPYMFSVVRSYSQSRMMQSSFNADGRVVKSFTSDWQCLKATVATEGVRGLWKGLGPCFIRQCPQVSIGFVVK